MTRITRNRIPKIPKHFTGHAAYQLRALLKHYNPLTKVQVMERLYDPTDDGPEVDIIKFFQQHPKGNYLGIQRCLHQKGRICAF